ncbi:MAG: hypothetical protein IPH96_17640 [Saprospiraceae bacterium]|nr:hypothetical protein [Saprospiraceae bacterium]
MTVMSSPTTEHHLSNSYLGQNVKQELTQGLFLPASIGNYVWEDLDKDGIQDAAELGINGVSVY